MTLKEMKIKVLSLIEEYNPDAEGYTDDPDIKAKLNGVINSINFEMARVKKLNDYVEIPVAKGQILSFDDIEEVNGYTVYQIDSIQGIKFKSVADGTKFKILSDGTAEINYFRMPEPITDKTSENGYEFENTPEVLEVMVYGIAADILKSDVSNDYGAIYANRYESLKAGLDPRNTMPTITFEEGDSTWLM